MSEKLFSSLEKDPFISALKKLLEENQSVVIEELWNTPKAFIASLAAFVTKKNILIITAETPEEGKLFHNFSAFTETQVLDFPSWETLPGEEISPSPDIVGERYKILAKLQEKKDNFVVITGLQAILQKLISKDLFSSLSLKLKKGQTFSFEKLINIFEKMQYIRSPLAQDKGEFAVRGGIIDVFPISSPDPFRIEFFGDTIESIRTYDPIGQKSIVGVQEIELVPGQESNLLQKETKFFSLLDYMGDDTIVILDDLLALEDRYATLKGLIGEKNPIFFSLDDLMDQLDFFQKIFFTKESLDELSTVKIQEEKGINIYSSTRPSYLCSFSFFSKDFEMQRWKSPFMPIRYYLLPEIGENETIGGQEILRSLKKLEKFKGDLFVFVDSTREKEYLIDLCQKENITFPPQTVFTLHYLSSGFAIPDSEIVFFPITEITHRHKIRRQKFRSTYHSSSTTELFDLLPGDTVVHLNNGIGIYRGIEKKANHEGKERDFLVIEYAEKAKLYVPLNQSYLISKYIGSSEEIPRLHTLGSQKWKKTKEQTEQAILAYASDLLQLYAERTLEKGYSFKEDSQEFTEFENTFPFVETEDQLQAISDTKVDMQSKKMMDRLICGDVGYGKTEVAIRAACKAVMDGGKQVAVLVPTTVLAMQHFDNFIERMQEFPITVGVLSRFRSPKEIRTTLEGVKQGSVDILIGTHRILSQDVEFNDLGLVIIDEEQRFGVKAKEKLKTIKKNVDCLTLSATPIPRTLYMSLVGARDMSVINSPPQDRLPIKTILAEPKAETIKTALLRELSRDGQIYFIHNRVESIYERSEFIQKLVPGARILIGHGQMDPDEIDTVFHAFKQGKADILVATTIVENGIDIPNANTIFIDRADQFGMADLYQLRGRVGRWNRRAYCYFLVSNLTRLTEIPRKRLQALLENSGGYGGGMRVAMRDLEIRGAGNILGHEQSGHVSAIGFHLYCKLLKRMVGVLQGNIQATLTDTRIDMPIDAYLPRDYIEETSIQMEIYQRLGETTSFSEIDEIFNELKDRFGPIPEPANWLYALTKVKVFAGTQSVTLIKKEKVSLYFEKKKGKKLLEKKILYPSFKTPQEFMETIFSILENWKE